MKISKVCAAIIVAGLATAVNAQSSTLQSTLGDAGRDRLQADQSFIHLAQAGGGQTDQGSRPGGQGGPGGGERRHGPPPEAIAACKDKASGAVCSFTGRNGENLTGTCFAPPARGTGSPGGQAGAGSSSGKPGDQGERPLACRPDRGGAGGGRGK